LAQEVLTMAESPRITSAAWGKTEIDGLEPGKDVKLWPGGGGLFHSTC
jgi:hypothetical protein